MGGADLVDSHGEKVWAGPRKWYKIQLADGSELGFGESHGSGPNPDRTLVKVVPAGQGLVIRYQRGEDFEGEYGWPQGDKGWLRGLDARSEAADVIKNLSMAGAGSDDIWYLCLFDGKGNYGFTTEQLPGNRVGLFMHDKYGEKCGIIVDSKGHLSRHKGKYAKALECSFVRIASPSDSWF